MSPQKRKSSLLYQILFVSFSYLLNKFVNFIKLNFQTQKEEEIKPKPLPEIKQAIKPKSYEFACWLCSGKTQFKRMPSEEKKYYTIDCNWCGIANKVKVDKS